MHDLAQRRLRAPIFRNSLGILSVKGAVTALRLVILFVLAYRLEPYTFGLIVFAIAIAEIGRPFADFGLDTLATRLIARALQSAYIASIIRALFTLKAGFSLLVYLLIIAFHLGTQSADQRVLGAICGLLVFTGSIMNAAVDYFQAKLATGQVAPLFLATTIAGAVAAIALILVAPSPAIAVTALVLVETALASVLLYRLKSEVDLRLVASREHLAFLKTLLRDASPIAASSILIMVYTRLDILFLSAYFDKVAVAAYSVAYRLTEPFQFVAVAFAASIYSHLSQQLETAAAFRTAVKRYVLGMLAYGAASAVFIGLIAPIAISYFLPAYQGSVVILRILAFALLFRPLNSVLTGVIQANGKFPWLTAVTIWMVVFVSALLFVFVGRMGAAGAALALLIGELSNTAIQLILVAILMRAQAVRVDTGAHHQPS